MESVNKLQLNPRTTLLVQPETGPVETIKILAPVRKESLRRTTISRATEPELFNLLLMRQIAEAKGWPHSEEFPESLHTRLAEVGMLVHENQIAKPVRFDCDVTPDLFDLVPKNAPRQIFENVPASDLMVNPSLRFIGTTQSLLENPTQKSFAANIQKDRFWYLVSLPDHYAPRLYSCDSGGHQYFRSLIPGKPAPTEIDPMLRRVFTAAEILVGVDQFEKSCNEARKKLDFANAELQANRYTVLRPFLHPFQVAAIRRYYSELVEEGYLPFGDQEWPLRFYTANDAIGRFYQELMQPILCRITRETVLPTFLFLASYRPGAVLPAHRDRDACEYSTSLLLDFVPEPNDVNPWPIYVESPEQPDVPIPILLGIGDMLLYRGKELLHYRHAFKEGEASTTWLFFYQPED